MCECRRKESLFIVFPAKAGIQKREKAYQSLSLERFPISIIYALIAYFEGKKEAISRGILLHKAKLNKMSLSLMDFREANVMMRISILRQEC
ncbi:hypothetical protein H5U35_05160 [Candidatus Aerophobetes bacterium]|nr:hypothetical protein [Candidatus Aerophobetes bacterium]